VENDYVRLGAYHTLDLELNRAFTLEKSEGWDSVAIQMLQEAVNNRGRAQIWAVIMEPGVANICYITEHQTVLQQHLAMNMPGKRSGSSDYDKVCSIASI
jgi:protein pelota